MNWKLHVAAPLAVIALGVGGYALLHATKPPPEEQEEPPRPVSVFVEPVRHQDMQFDVLTHGEVRPRTEVDLVAQVAGRVVAVSPEFTEGGVVRPGEALVTIEDTDHRLALQQARAAVADAEVGLEEALAAADVARRQLAGTPNPSNLALHKPQVAQARIRLEAAKANLSQAELDLERTRISLPFDGRVLGTSVDVGQYVSPGSPLGRAFATDTVEVRLPFSDAQLASLGLPIGYTADNAAGAPRMVQLNAVVGGVARTWTGRLTRLDAAIDPATRLVYGLAEVHDPYGSGATSDGMPLAVGLYVEARIDGRPVQAARVIPRKALRAGNQVFVVGEDGLLQIREVDVAHSDQATAVIGRGVARGEQVVVSSIRNAIQGMRVNPIAQGEATASATRTTAAGEG